jgi:hypothetical protein
MLVEQGLTRLVVPDEGSLEHGMLEALQRRGVQVLIAEGQASRPRNLCTMLPAILDA